MNFVGRAMYLLSPYVQIVGVRFNACGSRPQTFGLGAGRLGQSLEVRFFLPFGLAGLISHKFLNPISKLP